MNTLSTELSANINIVHYIGGLFAPTVGIDWSYKEHISTENKFYYITDGECCITVGDREYTARAGDWFFIPNGTRHSYRNDPKKPFKKYWIEFSVSPDQFLFSKFKMSDFIVIGSKGREHRLFNRYSKICRSNTVDNQLEIKSIIFRLLSSYLRLSNAELQPTYSKTSFLFKIQSYLDENSERYVTVNELADYLHMHPTHLVRLFKTATGQTPKNYITQNKMEAAKRMLLKTDLFIDEIAEKTGYFDVAAFSKAFKKSTNLSPSQFRKMHKRKPRK